MFRIKKVMFSLLFAGIIAFPAGLYGQDDMQSTNQDSLGTGSNDQSTETGTSGDQSKVTNTSAEKSLNNSSSAQFSGSSGFSSDQIDQAFARLNEKPDDNIKSQLEGIAESEARDLQTKLSLEDDSFNEIKDAINNYLDEGWKTRVELAQKAGNPDSYNDKSAELAYMRVDLAEAIKDELGETGEAQWNSHAVEFWTSLDKADFEVKAKEAGIASGSASGTEGGFNQDQNQMNQNQMNMENDQQNMNESQDNTELNQDNADENQDLNTSDQNANDQDKETEQKQDNNDQGE